MKGENVRPRVQLMAQGTRSTARCMAVRAERSIKRRSGCARWGGIRCYGGKSRWSLGRLETRRCNGKKSNFKKSAVFDIELSRENS